MSFVNAAPGSGHRELDAGHDLAWCLEVTRNWIDHLPPPKVTQVREDVWVVDESVLGIGSKARFADLFVSRVQEDELVYVQPRVGWAGLSLAYLAKRHGKKLTLWMPASKQVSPYQAAAIAAGAEPRFKRIAAMPNLNAAAQVYATGAGARFIPLGLRHPLVTAGLVAVARNLMNDPPEVWTVLSTGCLSRGLQIAWPTSRFVGVAVARNMQRGEVGRAEFLSYDRSFGQTCRIDPPVDSARNYDAKGLELLLQTPVTGQRKVFWNVAGEPPKVTLPEQPQSDVPWGA